MPAFLRPRRRTPNHLARYLCVWSGIDPVGSWYVDDDGPLEIWRELAADATGEPVDGGHFFPEEDPRETAHALAAFFSSQYH